MNKVITHDASILEDGQIQVRQITHIMENGKEIAKNFHRYVVDVGDTVSNEPQLIQDIAKDMHTPARIAARKKYLDSNKKE